MPMKHAFTPHEYAIIRGVAASGRTSQVAVVALRNIGVRMGNGTIRGSEAWIEGKAEYAASQAEQRAHAEAEALIEEPEAEGVVEWRHPATLAAVSLPKLSFQPAGWQHEAAEWWAS